MGAHKGPLRAALAASALAVALTQAPSAEAAPPVWSALPTGATTAPPKHRPASIGAGERVAGFHVVIPGDARRRPFAMVTTSAEAAKKIRREGDLDRADQRVCFATGDRSVDDDDPAAWETSLAGTIRLWPKSPDNPRAGVNALHTERVVPTASGATLEIVDMWVDPQTLGARLIGKASIPLALVGSAVGDVKVYAARQDVNGHKQVHWVVTRPLPTATFSTSTSLVAFRSGTVEQANECGHIRVTTSADRGSAESATVQAGVILPSRSPKAKPQEPEAKKSKNPLGFLRRLGHRGKRAAPVESHEIEARARDMEISVSSSMTSRDKEPLLAVSFGWSGREKVVRGQEEAHGE